MTAPAHRLRILAASAAAFTAAVLILVTTVLPAEYGWDPLGTGAAMGLTGLSAEQQLALHTQAEPWNSDRVSFQLAPFEAVEYAYRLEQGATLVYAWRADGEVLYNLHSQPDGMAPDYAESFSRARDTADAGSYSAPFSGLHGWYFQNRGQEDITLQLETAGFYSYSLESHEGGSQRKDF